MTDAPFDPTGALTFDLAAGRVSLKDSPPRVLVPTEQLSALCDAAGEEATRSLGRAMGESMGQRALRALTGQQQAGAASDGVAIERFVQHLAGEFALAGLGALTLERWGRAMVLVVAPGVAHDGLLKAVLESALTTSTGRTLRCAALAKAEAMLRYLVASPSTADRVEQELRAGKEWGEVLVQLHAAAPTAQPRGDA